MHSNNDKKDTNAKVQPSSTYGAVWKPTSRYEPCTYNNCGSKKKTEPNTQLSDSSPTNAKDSKTNSK